MASAIEATAQEVLVSTESDGSIRRKILLANPFTGRTGFHHPSAWDLLYVLHCTHGTQALPMPETLCARVRPSGNIRDNGGDRGMELRFADGGIR
jgi:hypothetical protein